MAASGRHAGDAVQYARQGAAGVVGHDQQRIAHLEAWWRRLQATIAAEQAAADVAAHSTGEHTTDDDAA